MGAPSLTPTWTGATGVASWQVMGGSSPTSFTYAAPPVGAGAQLPMVTKNSFPYWEVEALDATGQVLGTSPATATPAHVMIFGNSAFAPRRGLGAVPVGCVGVSSCAVTTTISSGRTTFATTKREFIPAGGGLAYFALTSAAQSALAKAHNHQLTVNVKVRVASGPSATRKLMLSSFTTSNPSPAAERRPVLPAQADRHHRVRLPRLGRRGPRRVRRDHPLPGDDDARGRADHGRQDQASDPGRRRARLPQLHPDQRGPQAPDQDQDQPARGDGHHRHAGPAGSSTTAPSPTGGGGISGGASPGVTPTSASATTATAKARLALVAFQ